MTSEKYAVFFISTGRSGTQTLTKSLSTVFVDLAEVVREPLHHRYEPNRYFRKYDSIDEMRNIPLIRDHIAHIHEILKSRHYIETGWPSYATLPLMIEEFGPNIRIVQLVRNPVKVALSLCTHKFYLPTEEKESYSLSGALDPINCDVFQKDYAEKWDAMSQMDKCLFHWTEIYSYGEELNRRFPNVPFHRVRLEDLVSRDARHARDLMAFLELPEREAFVDAVTVRTDNIRDIVREPIDPTAIKRHPRTIELAHALGYDLKDVRGFLNHLRLSWRYRNNFATSLARRIRKKWKKIKDAKNEARA